MSPSEANRKLDHLLVFVKVVKNRMEVYVCPYIFVSFLSQMHSMNPVEYSAT